MKKKKYLPLYFKWMKSGKIPYVYGENSQGGLCSIYENNKLFALFIPYSCELKTAPTYGYWGCDGFRKRDSTTFTPLRQNILLFMACMAGEL